MPTLALAGDVMLGRGVSYALAQRPPQEPWGDVLPLLAQADLRLVNLECALTDARTPWARTPKVFHFRADPGPALACLRAARIDGCALANNHVLDFEEQGLRDTLRHLDAAGVRRAGAGRDLEEARQPALFDVGGTRVALLAVTDNEPDFAAGPGRPGTFYLPVSLERGVLAQLESAVAGARAAGAQVVVLSNHWGPNMVERPPPLFRAFARAAVDRGVDLYFGHSAHLFQGVELYRGRLILYDTGDFLDDYAVDPELRNDWSFLFRATLQGDGRLAQLELCPVELSFASVRRARGLPERLILERMRDRAAELGAELTERGGRLYLAGEEAALPSGPPE